MGGNRSRVPRSLTVGVHGFKRKWFHTVVNGKKILGFHTLHVRDEISETAIIRIPSLPLASEAKTGDALPIKHGGITYRTHASHVVAESSKTGKQTWSVPLFPSIEPKNPDPTLDTNTQWNIIVGLKESGHTLIWKTRITSLPRR